MRRAAPARSLPGLSGGDAALLVAITTLCLLGLVLWGAGEVGLALRGGDTGAVSLSGIFRIALGVLVHPADPALAWPPPARRDLPPAGLLYLAAAALAGGVAAPAALVVLRRRRPEPGPATWATRRELHPLLLRAGQHDRLVLGYFGSRLVATESRHSVICLGPTQSGKTSALAIPALLEWRGPAVATSVKSDLVRDTAPRRGELGKVQLFDPAAIFGELGSGWSPLAAAQSWHGARRVAASLCSVARPRSGQTAEADFWYATAEKLLAPLLFAAASSGAQMGDVVRWVDGVEVDAVLDALEAAAVPEALLAAQASFGRDARQLSSVYTTAETVLAAFADPAVLAASGRDEISPARLVRGGCDTLYLVAPTHEQARLAPVFVALLREVLAAAFSAAESSGGRLAPPLLLVLDEAANIAPLDDLDALASTAASHGIQLVTVFQDLAQLDARYGRRGATVLNNHRAKLVFPGISDGGTLQQLSELIGEAELPAAGESVDHAGRRATSRNWSPRRLAPADRLRRLRAGEAVLLYGNLPPVRLRQRPFYATPGLRELAAGTGSPPVSATTSRRWRRRVPAHASRGSRRGRRGARRSDR